MKSWSKRAPQAGAAVALAVLLTNGVVSFLNTRRLTETDQAVAHSYAVKAALGDLLSTLKDAESGQRGFVITGDDRYLEPYTTALQRYRRAMDELKALTLIPAHHETAIAIERKAADKLAEMARVLDVRRGPGGFGAARNEIRTDLGQNLMDDIRDLAGELGRSEDSLLRDRQADATAVLRTNQAANLAGAVAGLAMVALAYYLVFRDRTAELTRANTRLQSEVTERTAAEQRVTVFADELQRSNRELQEFAFVASHDLQEPLRKIRAFGDRLRDKCRDQLSDQGRDYLDRIQAAATRMSALISDLLTYSRVSARGEAFARVDLGQVAAEVVSDLEGRVQQTGGRVEVGDLPAVDADPTQMRQLLQNLIGNALKFHRPDVPPVVRVSARVTEDGPPGASTGGTSGRARCMLTVSDNGIGFEAQYRDKIFGFFQRLHARDRYDGTGMGLAICRRIAERHGGTVTAAGIPGEGATFTVSLPVTHTPEATPDDPGPAADHDPDGGR